MADEAAVAVVHRGHSSTWNEWIARAPRTSDGWRADLSRSQLAGVDLRGADLREVLLCGANLDGADLREADLRNAFLDRASLRKAKLQRANLAGATLMRAELFLAEMQEATLTGAALHGADLHYAYLNGANLARATLHQANLRDANLLGAVLNDASLRDADLSSARLRYASLVRADIAGARFDACMVYGASVWSLHGIPATQKDIVITPGDEPTITADNIEMAQFLYLLLDNQKLRTIIDTITSKIVLILGSFEPRRKMILDSIRKLLRTHKYLPVFFDFSTPASRDTQETITTLARLARLARFVIADLTNPKSVPQELASVVESLPSVRVQPLLEEGSQPWGMYDHIRRYPWVREIHIYSDERTLVEAFEKRLLLAIDGPQTTLRE